MSNRSQISRRRSLEELASLPSNTPPTKVKDFLRAAADSDKIQPPSVEISTTTRFWDKAKRMTGKDVGPHAGELVREQVEQFKGTLERMKEKVEKSYLNYLPKDLRDLFLEVAVSLHGKFQSSLEEFVGRSKHKERRDTQDSIKRLNTQFNDMEKALDGWRYMATIVKNMPSHASNNGILEAKDAYRTILNEYKKNNAQPSEWKSFQNIVDKFKKPMERWEGQDEALRGKHLDEFFKRQFIYHLIERSIDLKDLPSYIHRKMITEDVGIRLGIQYGKQYGKDVTRAFAIAQGKANEEKSKLVPYKDTTQDFNAHYYIEKGKFTYKKCVGVRRQQYSHRASYPYEYNILRGQKHLGSHDQNRCQAHRS